MRTARVKKNAEGVSLFPFLAVLLCTMGSLIVVLVVLSHQAQLQGALAAAPPPAAAPPADEKSQEAEDLAWQIEQMAASRDKTSQDLENERLKLGHVEDHIRRLREEMQQVIAAAEEMKRSHDLTDAQRQAAVEDLRRLEERLAAEIKDVDALAQNQSKKRSYAIVPYEGPNGTRRRPIYLECRADAIVLQPEGIALSEDDLEGRKGPGNPLAAALRATREYYAAQDPTNDRTMGKPYPLLLVRPDGVLAYAVARSAVQAWGADFGYELIGADWKLAFPPADANLAELQRQAIAQAKAFQPTIVAEGRGRGRGGMPSFRASPTHGGFVREDRFAGVGEKGNAAGSGTGSGPGRGGALQHDRYGRPLLGSRGGQRGAGPTPGAPGSPANAGGAAAGNDPVGPRYAAAGNPAGGSQTDAKSAPGGARSAGVPAQAASYGAGNKLASNAAGAQGSAAAHGKAGANAAGSPGGGQASGSSSPGGTASGGAGGGAAGAGAGAGGMAGQGGPQGGQNRGSNWALPGASQRAVGIARSVRVVVREDRLIIVAEPGTGENIVVPLGERTEDSLDAFVGKLHEYMQRWGIAGNNLYWQPTLVLQTGVDGEGRAQDLTQLLDGSGLGVRSADATGK